MTLAGLVAILTLLGWQIHQKLAAITQTNHGRPANAPVPVECLPVVFGSIFW